MIIKQGELNDQLLIKPYSHLVSLVPSITWLLFDLQLHDNIKGITKFCKAANDQHLKYLTVGGTKNPNLLKITQLHPDLILANKEENTKEDIEELSKDCTVYLSDIRNLNDMYQMISDIGFLTDRVKSGREYISLIKSKQKENFTNSLKLNEITVAYLIWKDPYMTVGSDTFIHYMLQLAGFKNCFDDKIRYPIVTYEDLMTRNPTYVLLSSEPYPFKEKNFIEFNPLDVKLVDGRFFSWYGTFILQSFKYLDAFKIKLKSKL